MELKYCARCGEKMSENATECPHCSENNPMSEPTISNECQSECNVSEVFDSVRAGSNLSDKQKGVKMRTVLISVTVAALFITFAMVGLCIYQGTKLAKHEEKLSKYEAMLAEYEAEITEYEKNKADEDAKRADEEARQAEYSKDMNDAVYTMLDGLVNAESMGNLVQSVWSNAIYKRSDDATDPYTKVNGYFVDDFNDALSNLFASESFTYSVSTLSENKTEVVALMKKLNDPPEKYEEVHSLLMEYYNNYTKMVNAVMNPQGSLNSFSEEFKALDENAVESYEKLVLYLE